MPLWLAPVQAVVCSITDASGPYAAEVAQTLKKQGFRVEADLRNEKIGYKIREHAMQKLPLLLVVGDKERQAGLVAARARGGIDLGVMSLDQAAALLGQAVRDRAIDVRQASA